MTQTVVFTDIDLVTGVGSITIKTTEGGVDTYSTKNISLNPADKTSITTILGTYIQE